MTRRRIGTWLAVCVIACCGASLAPAAALAQASCNQSSTRLAYGGEATQITQLGCPEGSTLPFTGLDLGLLVVAGLILIAGGTVLGLRVRHGGR